MSSFWLALLLILPLWQASAPIPGGEASAWYSAEEGPNGARIRVASHGVQLSLHPASFCRDGADRCAGAVGDRVSPALPVHSRGLVRIRIPDGARQVRLRLECGRAGRLGSSPSGNRWRFMMSAKQGSRSSCDQARVVVRSGSTSGVGATTSRYRLQTKPDSPWRRAQRLVGPKIPVAGMRLARGPGRLAVVLYHQGTIGAAPLGESRDASKASTGATALKLMLRRPHGRQFQQPETVARRFEDFKMAMADDGTIRVAWLDGRERIHFARVNPRHGLMGERVISPPGVNGYSVAVNTRGAAVVGWSRGPLAEQSVSVVTKLPQRPFASPMVLSTDGEVPLVALNRVGVSVAAWEAGADKEGPIQVATLDHEGSLLSKDPISGSRRSNDGFDMAINDAGAVGVLVNGRRSHQVVRQSVRGPRELSFPPATRLFPRRQTGNFSDIAFDGRGRFRASWSSENPSGVGTSTHRPGSPTWTPPRRISHHSRDSFGHVGSCQARSRPFSLDPQGECPVWRISDAGQRLGRP